MQQIPVWLLGSLAWCRYVVPKRRYAATNLRRASSKKKEGFELDIRLNQWLRKLLSP
jgi:hypothetical protein